MVLQMLLVLLIDVLLELWSVVSAHASRLLEFTARHERIHCFLDHVNLHVKFSSLMET